MNGYDVCQQMRATEWGRSALLVAVTGWGQAADRTRSADAGFDHHLVKPVELKKITELLAPT